MTDPDLVASILEDAAHFPGGHAGGVVAVETEADVAATLALGRPVLAIGAQSSLTGGATPRGEIVITTARLDDISSSGDSVLAGAGVSLERLQATLSLTDGLYPPVPTFAGATVGGVVATNAAGPATFKYGTTRDWVLGLTVVLADGSVVDINRGEHRAHPDGYFEIHGTSGPIRVPIGPVARPAVPKCSAGYALAPAMDLVDLFVGAEGTLGVITAARLRVIRHPPAPCLAVIRLESEADATALAAALRHHAHATWRDRDPRGLDVSAIEHIDARSVALPREDGTDRALDLPLPPGTAAVLFIALDLPSGSRSATTWADVSDALEPDAPDTPLARFCRLLAARDLLDRAEIALPDASARRAQLVALREAVPLAVNHRIAVAQQAIGPDLSKMAGDFVVPFEGFTPMVDACRAACVARDLDLAIWGHISDGNIHPNVLPHRLEDGAAGRAALLEAGREVIRLGGSPLAEHGVGRNPLKQELLRMLHGEPGLAAMRAVRRALDPGRLLAPGLLGV